MQTPYVTAALDGELAQLETAAPGTRNAALFRTAARLYQFAEAGVLSHDDLTAQLHAAAEALRLPQREVRATLRSAARRARGHAAQLPHGTARLTLPLAPLMAPEPATPPTAVWQDQATAFMAWAERRLWQPEGQRALAWLTQQRGLRFATIVDAGLGYNPHDWWSERAAWGLPEERDAHGPVRRLWVPRGIVIPWLVDGVVWRVFIRRPLTTQQIAAGEPTYVQLPGGTNALYNADALRPGRPAMLVEGAFDALAVQQEASDLVAAVASGTTGARRVRWIAALSACQPLLLSFDADAGGAEATSYWQDVLGEAARPWLPTVDDPATMVQAGMDVRAWVTAGLQKAIAI